MDNVDAIPVAAIDLFSIEVFAPRRGPPWPCDAGNEVILNYYSSNLFRLDAIVPDRFRIPYPMGASVKWKEWLENWSMTSLKINAWFLEMEWNPKDADRDAAWELYIELLTRVTTQPLADTAGNDASALESVYALFPTTREIIKRYGRGAAEFAKISVIVLNQVIRPFTAKWHPRFAQPAGMDAEQRMEFRRELDELQVKLRVYTRMLGDMSGIEEDFTRLEAAEGA